MGATDALLRTWLGTQDEPSFELVGNTQAVAMRHYVDVTDADFERAATGGGVPDSKAAQSVRVRSGYESRAEGWAQEKTPVLQDAATSRESGQNRGMEAAGIEPASCGLLTRTSTCVVR